MPLRNVSLDDARRIVLAAQGFARARPARPRAAHVRRVIHELGLLQIDYVNVLVPAHYQVPFSRLGPYERPILDRLVFEHQEFTEQWAHVASIVPMSAWPLLEHRRRQFDGGPRLKAFARKHHRYLDAVLEAVREHGPISADDLDCPEGVARKIPGAWSRSVPRVALDWHFGQGRVVATNRLPNFMRQFDLTERVVPAEHRRRSVGREEAQRELLRIAARAQGIATAGDLSDYWRMPTREARSRLAELVATGDLREVAVEGWNEPAFLDPRAKQPRRIAAAALLSPFDPMVWTRARVARLFGFDYKIEIFFPEKERRWGYYVLPFLLGERLVARVDLKAERTARRLDVLASHVESHADPSAVSEPLARELHTMARWLDLDEVRVGRRGNLARELGPATRRASC